MVKQTEFGITVDRCGQCDGAWFDSGELELFLKRRADEEATEMSHTDSEAAS